MHDSRHYFYDFTTLFKNGGVPEVQILHWYTVEGYPRAVIEVIARDEQTNPPEGEIRSVKIDGRLYSMSHQDHIASLEAE